jgi:hypothetical protein
MGIVNTSAFLDEHGQVDEVKVSQHFGTLFGGQQPQAPRQWGQHSTPGAPVLRPGDRGRLAAAKRHGGEVDPELGAATAGVERGSRGRAEAHRRFGDRKAPQH